MNGGGVNMSQVSAAAVSVANELSKSVHQCCFAAMLARESGYAATTISRREQLFVQIRY
jgi:hypothetical protein